MGDVEILYNKKMIQIKLPKEDLNYGYKDKRCVYYGIIAIINPRKCLAKGGVVHSIWGAVIHRDKKFLRDPRKMLHCSKFT